LQDLQRIIAADSHAQKAIERAAALAPQSATKAHVISA